jgi:hypothetical protein
MGAIPLSNNSIGCRNSAMSNYVNEQLINILNTSKKFAMQLNESTHDANCSIHTAYGSLI